MNIFPTLCPPSSHLHFLVISPFRPSHPSTSDTAKTISSSQSRSLTHQAGQIRCALHIHSLHPRGKRCAAGKVRALIQTDIPTRPAFSTRTGIYTGFSGTHCNPSRVTARSLLTTSQWLASWEIVSSLFSVPPPEQAQHNRASKNAQAPPYKAAIIPRLGQTLETGRKERDGP